MQIGKLRKRVTIQEFVESRDSIGGVIHTWSVIAIVWGDVRLAPGFDTREEFVTGANRVIATATHRITLRYGLITKTMTPGMRLLVEGKTFEIESTGDADGKKMAVVARCRELVL